jgi:hypothetical protein
MPPLVTTNATIMCIHGGRLQVTPARTDITIRGGVVIGADDVLGGTILGCAPPTGKPCMKVVALNPGSTSLKAKVGRQAACLATLTGATDAGGVVKVVQPDQATVQG